MKTPLRLLLLLLAIVLIVPTVTPTNSPAQATKEVKAPPAPPKGVSPANPDIDLPNIGQFRCPNCGAEYPRMSKKEWLNRPRLGARSGDAGNRAGRNRAFNRTGRGRANCDMPGGGHAFNRSGRSRRSGAPGMRGNYNSRPGMRGHRDGNAAMRMAMRAEQLDLTKEQVAKLEQLAYDTKTELIDLRAAMEKEKLELQQLRRSDSDNLTAITRHLKSIANLRVEVQTAKIANRIDARKVLTEDQKELLNTPSPRMGRRFNR